ncbi:MAG: PAS domain-containing methyl-accepting chemotaxis protein [Gallionella sp.]|nr:PAS domain-containing methyl-accepting chemotaxis protein [Gallionella sp.]
MQNKHAYVSQQEVPFPQGKVLISKTDIKGFITYCNDEFEAISGYSRSELLGANHNIVRHPDMPPAAFKWMWDTLHAGRPWRGTVKNRCKNGDYYWVRATIVPIIENGHTTGYVSMRRAPSRVQIADATELYRAYNQTGEEFVSKGEKMKFKNWSLKSKLQLVIQSALLFVLGLGQWFISSRLQIDATTELELLGGQVVLHVFLFFFLGYCVVKYVREPLDAAKNELRNVLQGNFDSELDVSVGDEVGDMCCEVTNMQTYLRMLVDEIAASARVINQLSAQLDSQVSGVAENAQFEQQQVRAIFNTMEQFRSSVVEVAQMADVSLGDARATQKTVEENNRNMDLSIAAAGKVSDTVQASSKTISDLRVSIQKIGTISNAIKDIAEQTNLLALNAAIEAARAGEQGRGFAVVADEVRKLAERTATSTKDIAVTIDEINSISGSAVQSMHDAVIEVETSIGLIRKNGEGLKEIMLASVNVSDRVQHIATASGQQSAASGSVADSLQQISNLVDSNTQSVSEAKTATEALARSASDLRKAGYPLTKCAIS